jgi:hypothetical protein
MNTSCDDASLEQLSAAPARGRRRVANPRARTRVGRVSGARCAAQELWLVQTRRFKVRAQRPWAPCLRPASCHGRAREARALAAAPVADPAPAPRQCLPCPSRCTLPAGCSRHALGSSRRSTIRS